MYVNTEQLQLGVTRFIDVEIGSKAVGFGKFATYFVMPMVTAKIPQYVESYSSNILTQDMFDSNKNIDIDKLYNYAKSAIQKSGQFVWNGIVFCETDIDKLFNYIKGGI